MGILLSDKSFGRDNNFNLMRFIAAFMVLLSHSYALSLGTPDAEPLVALTGFSPGSIAVDIFFVTSGFLIAGSLVNRNNVYAFIWARTIRIYPALLVCVALMVFVLGPIMTSFTISDYFTDFSTYKYLIRNSILFAGVDHYLPGVFTDLPYPKAVNGSLWTLPHEVRMYALLLLSTLAIQALKDRGYIKNIQKAFAVIAVSAILLQIINSHINVLPQNHINLKLLSMFFAGSALYMLHDHIVLSTRVAVAMTAIVLLALLIDKQIFYVAYSIFMPYLVIYLAYIPKGIVRHYNRFGDYSYGMYVYAFPVQQVVVSQIGGGDVVSVIIYSFAITLVLAYASWHVIEKRALRHKGKYTYVESMFTNSRLYGEKSKCKSEI